MLRVLQILLLCFASVDAAAQLDSLWVTYSTDNQLVEVFEDGSMVLEGEGRVSFLSPSGELSRIIFTPSSALVVDAVQLEDGSLIVAGRKNGSWVARYNPVGVLEWSHSISLSGPGAFYGIQLVGNDQVLAVGRYCPVGDCNRIAAVHFSLFSLGGELLWSAEPTPHTPEQRLETVEWVGMTQTGRPAFMGSDAYNCLRIAEFQEDWTLSSHCLDVFEGTRASATLRLSNGNLLVVTSRRAQVSSDQDVQLVELDSNLSPVQTSSFFRLENRPVDIVELDGGQFLLLTRYSLYPNVQEVWLEEVSFDGLSGRRWELDWGVRVSGHSVDLMPDNTLVIDGYVNESSYAEGHFVASFQDPIAYPTDYEELADDSGFKTGIYPNPTQGRLHVVLEKPVSSPVTIQLFDSLGRVIASRVVDPPTGTAITTDILTRVTPGVYLVRVLNERVRMAQSVVRY